jgi:hypothetical protein
LFRNRQPRFTIFICPQNPYSIQVKIRRNFDSLWLFGGFTDSSMFQRLLSSFSPGDEDKDEALYQYHDFYVHDPIQFNLNPQELKLYLYTVMMMGLVKKKGRIEKKKKVKMNLHVLSQMGF